MKLNFKLIYLFLMIAFTSCKDKSKQKTRKFIIKSKEVIPNGQYAPDLIFRDNKNKFIEVSRDVYMRYTEGDTILIKD